MFSYAIFLTLGGCESELQALALELRRFTETRGICRTSSWPPLCDKSLQMEAFKVVLTLLALASALDNALAVKTAVFAVYKFSSDGFSDLPMQLSKSTSALTFVSTRDVVQCEHPSSVDISSDDRISIGARPGLLSGSRRGYDDLVDTVHVTEYIGHTQALKAFLASTADVGIVLYHPSPISRPAASVLSSALSSLRTGGGGLVSSPATTGSGTGSGTGGAQQQWDVLLLSHDVAPESESPPASFASLLGSSDDSWPGSLPGGGVKGHGAGQSSVERGKTAAHPSGGGATVKVEVVQARGWRGLYAYALTRAAAKHILSHALPMNVRWWAHMSSLGVLGELAIGWVPTASPLVTTTAPDPIVQCDLCDLPSGFSRLAHVRNHLSLGAVLGSAATVALIAALNKIAPGGAAGVWATVTAVLGRKGSEVDESHVTERSSRARRACLACAAGCRHPAFQLTVLALIGYVGARAVVYPPWPAERFFNTGQYGALERVSLTGRAASDWAAFVKTVNTSSTRVHHATVSTLAHPNLERLVASAAWYGDKVTVLGMNDPRFVKWGKGFGVKLELTHAFVKALPPNDLFMFTDAFDVLMMAGSAELRNAYLHAVKLAMARERVDPSGAVPARVPSVLFSAEFFCHPDPGRDVAYPQIDRQYEFAYLNSGTYIGRAGDIARMMDLWSNYSIDDDDQRYWTTIYLASRSDPSLPRIVLDHESDVFLCMSGYRMDRDLDFDPALRRYKSKRTPGLPGVIHFNNRKHDVVPFFDALMMKWSPYDISTSQPLQLVVALLVIFTFPIGVSIGRTLDAIGIGIGSGAGKGCCAACRRTVQRAAATSNIAAVAVARIPVPARGRNDKSDE